jgi:hypothetical protein
MTAPSVLRTAVIGCVLAIACILGEAGDSLAERKTAIEFRIVFDAPRPGKATQEVRIGGKRLFVAARAVLTRMDIKAA